MLILSINDYIIKSTKKILIDKFDIKNLGVASVILRIRITWESTGFVLFQSHYVKKTLNKFFKGDSNIIKTPIDISAYRSKLKQKEGVHQLECYWIIRSLGYVINYTRSNVAYLKRNK
jgi:hypothetical protein